jgi:hypothetical protein
MLVCAMANISPPTCRGASESAATLPASVSTGLPAASARVNVGAPSGSTPTIRMRPSYQAAMPPINPPPPTATSSVCRLGACSLNSSPTLPWPSSVSSWSKAWIRSAPDWLAHSWLAANASA